MEHPDFFYVERNSIRNIVKVAEKLYSERRFSGDEMRDMAQMLQMVVETAINTDSFKSENFSDFQKGE